MSMAVTCMYKELWIIIKACCLLCVNFCGLQNAEIFTLTYGSLVRQLLADLEEVEAVNKQLDTM